MFPSLEFGNRCHIGGPDNNQHVRAVTGGPDQRRATYPHFAPGDEEPELNVAGGTFKFGERIQSVNVN
jgi:hypothetical protein